MIDPEAFDGSISRAASSWSDRAVRLGVSGLIAGVALGVTAVVAGRAIEGFRTLAGLFFGGVFPLLLAASVVGGGALLFTSTLDGEQSAHVGAWWLIGTLVAGTTGVGILAFESSSGVGLTDPEVVLAGNAATGGLGGLVVGWYDARRLAVAAEREREREQLADEREKLALLNRILRHDIGNDLQVVAGMADVLERHVDDDGADALERLQRTSEEAIELTERVRTFVSLLEDERTLRPIAIERIVRTQVENVADRHPEATVELDGSIPDVAVSADELLASVVHNLLSNAIVHNDSADPHVIVTVEATPDTVRLTVADNGPGIPDDRKGTLFEQGELGTESAGSGIGLYIVAMLVDHYGGAVRVEDASAGGAAFVVELERAPTGEGIADAPEPALSR